MWGFLGLRIALSVMMTTTTAGSFSRTRQQAEKNSSHWDTEGLQHLGGKLGKSSCPENSDDTRETAVQVERQDIVLATVKLD